VRAAAGVIVAVGLLARVSAASEPDAGATDVASPPSAIDADATEGAAAPPPAPAVHAPPAPAAAVYDPVRAAQEAAQRTRDRWPLAYVDRPQTLLEGMDAFTATTRDWFGGPAGYRRLLLGMSYEKALADWFEIWLGLPHVYCTGNDAGACSSTLQPEVGATAALVRAPRARLALGASLFDVDYSITAWTRLKLVLARRFSFEIEPSVVLGIRDATMPAWWNPSVPLDANQTRAYLALDANLQLTEHVLAWADAIPYAPTANLGGSFDAAVEVIGGLTVSFTKALQLGAACGTLNVLATRRWEYVPDVRLCRLTFVARGFGPGPSGLVTVADPQPLY
jgi:hypothetical protein